MQIQYTKNLNPERFELGTDWVSRMGLYDMIYPIDSAKIQLLNNWVINDNYLFI